MLLGTFLRVFYVTSPPFVAQFCLSALVLAQWYGIFKHFTMNTTHCSSLLIEAVTRSRGCWCLLVHKDGQARPGLGEQGMIVVWEGEGGGGGGWGGEVRKEEEKEEEVRKRRR